MVRIVYDKKGNFNIKAKTIRYIGYEYFEMLNKIKNEIDSTEKLLNHLNRSLKEYKVDIILDISKIEQHKKEKNALNLIDTAISYEIEYLKFGMHGYRYNKIRRGIKNKIIENFIRSHKIECYTEFAGITFEMEIEKYEKKGYTNIDISLERNMIENKIKETNGNYGFCKDNLDINNKIYKILDMLNQRRNIGDYIHSLNKLLMQLSIGGKIEETKRNYLEQVNDYSINKLINSI